MLTLISAKGGRILIDDDKISKETYNMRQSQQQPLQIYLICH